MLDAAVEKEKSGGIAVFGANKKIALKLPYPGLQLSSGGGFNTIHNVHDENSPVKLKIEKNTKSLQFKKWFAGSKVVDEKGDPLVVYHGSSADFTVFAARQDAGRIEKTGVPKLCNCRMFFGCFSFFGQR